MWLACGNENRTDGTEPLPDNPTEVVRLYHKYLDKNDFKAAERLCTEAERLRLLEIAEIIGEEPSDSTLFNTVFLELSCVERQDSAICACLIEDFEEKYRDTLRLVRLKGQWLIDVREDRFLIENDEFFEDFEPESEEK